MLRQKTMYLSSPHFEISCQLQQKRENNLLAYSGSSCSGCKSPLRPATGNARLRRPFIGLLSAPMFAGGPCALRLVFEMLQMLSGVLGGPTQGVDRSI